MAKDDYAAQPGSIISILPVHNAQRLRGTAFFVKRRRATARPGASTASSSLASPNDQRVGISLPGLKIESDRELRRLLTRDEGYILNASARPASSGRTQGVLHRVGCPYLENSNATTTKWYFETMGDAHVWLTLSKYGKEGTTWRRCESCK
jgi:hypothetical protein